MIPPRPSLHPSTRIVQEVPVGDFPAVVHPEWAERFEWLVQGTTVSAGANGAPASDDGVRIPFDLGLFSDASPPRAVVARWERLRSSMGMSEVVHAHQVHSATVRWHRRSVPGLHVVDPGRGAPPIIGGGDMYATVLFDFPGDYKIRLIVGDNDVPQNTSSPATFDIHVRGPKAFRVTLDWYEQTPNNRKVDVDLHLLKPGSSNTFSPDDCCPTKVADPQEDPLDPCEHQVDWGSYGTPIYQTDNWEDPDGALWPNPGNFGDEIDFNNPGMGDYPLYVYFRCHSSANMSTYICCDDALPPCPFSPWCNDTCDRAAAGVVRLYVTGYDDQETEVAHKEFAFTHEIGRAHV